MQARLLDLGLRPYREVWDVQHNLHDRVGAGEALETWIFVEHRPVVTLGRNAKTENVLLSREVLAQRGVDVVEIERGGDVTYHGPGQLVVYPIRKLRRFREVVPFVRSLEGAVLAACEQFGVRGERAPEHAGVWVNGNQLCAIGLAVRKMTSLHGIALNVCNELSYTELINPCGLQDRGLTNLSREAGRAISMDEVKAALLASFSDEFGLRFVCNDCTGDDACVCHGEYVCHGECTCHGEVSAVAVLREPFGCAQDRLRDSKGALSEVEGLPEELATP